MEQKTSTFHVNLFYSYSHKDEKYRESMEMSLSMLKREGLLEAWSDQKILPGQLITQNIEEKLKESNIIVFLISQHYIASDECMREWERAKQLETNKPLFRIPIILTDCAWKDLLAEDDLKALPKDGKPISTFSNRDTAWQQVYDGIKFLINHMRKTFTPKPEFLEEQQKTYFLAEDYIRLQDIFVFPMLSCRTLHTIDGQPQEKKITTQDQLLEGKYSLVHGEEMSGKTALGKHLFLSLVEERTIPTLYIDLEKISGNPNEKIFSIAYSCQFNGDYSLWKRQKDKTLILDNLSSRSNLIEFVVFAKDYFDRIFVTLSSDVFNSFFRDEVRLADFREIKIEPLTHRQQEDLIRKRLKLSSGKYITDGLVDQIENRVNSIIISKKIVPRYPFFVLCILQAYETYMPESFSITSYGHCYHSLIIANLIKAGIPRSDEGINACFNFAENLAFKISQSKKKLHQKKIDFDKFIEQYRKRFFIGESILNRLISYDYGIITEDGCFKAPYMYYFFLGRFLSKSDENIAIIEKMCEASYLASNYLTLLFIIHHTNDNQIIDDILVRTMCTLDSVDPAKLDRDETRRFGEILSALPKNILSSNTVEEERNKEKDLRDISDSQVEDEYEPKEKDAENPATELYRILKNNEIMGQILRNKYGILEKTKIEEIIEIIADSGLRLVNSLLKSEDEIAHLARYLHEKFPDHDIYKIQNLLRFISFVWAIINIEKIVNAINVPEIREAVSKVVWHQSTPAYDLIGYFNQLDSTEELTDEIRNELDRLLKIHKDIFIQRILSIRTQHYMNTHRSKRSIEQSVCSLLEIKFFSKYPPPKP